MQKTLVTLVAICLFLAALTTTLIMTRPKPEAYEVMIRNAIAKQKILDYERGKLIKQSVGHRTVRIQTVLPNIQNGYSGSGMIVSKNGFILSAEHVHIEQWQPNITMTVMLEDGREFGAQQTQIVDFDKAVDLLLIKLEDNHTVFDSVPLLDPAAANRLTPGDMLILSGYAYFQSHPLVTDCKFISLINDDKVPVIWFDWFNGPGDSGGGLHTASGALIGIFHSVAGSDGFSRIGRGASPSVIRAFLDKNHVPYDTTSELQ